MRLVSRSNMRRAVTGRSIFRLAIVMLAVMLTSSVLTGCFLFTGRIGIEDHVIEVTTERAVFQAKLAEEDIRFFEEDMEQKEIVVFEEFLQFTEFFEGYEYEEYKHLLRVYEDFDFGIHNLVIIRTQRVTESRVISLLGFFSNSVTISTATFDEGINYILLVLKKETINIVLES